MKDGEGFEFCEDIRKFSDVYIIKPFGLIILISKIKAIEKRLKNNLEEKLISRKIVFSLKEMRVFFKDEITLSKNELNF